MTRRIRVYELARELGLDTKVLISRLNEMGIQVRNHMTALDEKLAQDVRRKLSGADKQDGSPERHPRAEEAQAAKAREAQRRGRQGKPAGHG